MQVSDFSAILRGLDATERNHRDLARSVTALTDNIEEVRRLLEELCTDREMRKERDKNLNQSLDKRSTAPANGCWR